MVNDFVTEIRKALKTKVSENTHPTTHHCFKPTDDIKFYGIKMAEVRKIGKGFLKRLTSRDAIYSVSTKEHIFGICEQLLKSGYLEEAVIACMFSEALHKKYEPSDFKTFEHWVNTYIRNWADCDTLCNHTIGDFLMKYPEFIAELKKWAKSSHRWTKRASSVTLIIPARKGLFLQDIFEIANTLLSDKDDLVQKGYGWMLKSASEAHLEEVYEYILSKRDIMPRTALRYAIEKMPADMRAEAMKKGK